MKRRGTVNVTKTFLPPLSRFVRLLKSVWKNGQITNNGPLSALLKEQIANHLAVENVELVTNGTIALQLAIRALDVSGEVITTPYSYVATLNSLLWERCVPTFVDIEPERFCIDPSLIEAAITPKTTAILATHVYGYPCDVVAIQSIADKHGLKVIYDAAHGYGVRFKGQSLMSYGDCSTLSFHATKLFHSGEGGAVVSKSVAVAKRIFLMKKFGHIGEEDYLEVGINGKLSEIHAALGLAVLPYWPYILESRRRVFQWYDEALLGLSIQRPLVPDGLEYNYAYYPIILPTAQAMEAVRSALISQDIHPRRYFFPSLNTLSFLDPKLRISCPVSESIASRVLCLPLYDSLTEKTALEICSIVRSILNREHRENRD